MLLLGLLTILLFPITAFGIHFFFSLESFLSIFSTKSNYLVEVGIGVLIGIAGGFLGWGLISIPFMREVRRKYQGLIYSLRLDLFTIVFVSFCAGIGEEILFRGVLQDYFGIWVTSILFVGIHGYLSPKNWRVSIYGTYMVLLIALLGYLSIRFGLLTAMIAHSFIDIVLFWLLTNKPLPQHIASSSESNDQ